MQGQLSVPLWNYPVSVLNLNELIPQGLISNFQIHGFYSLLYPSFKAPSSAQKPQAGSEPHGLGHSSLELMSLPREHWGRLLSAASQDAQEGRLADVLRSPTKHWDKTGLHMLSASPLTRGASSIPPCAPPYPIHQCRAEAWHQTTIKHFKREPTCGLRGEGSEGAAAQAWGRWRLLGGLPAAPLGLTLRAPCAPQLWAGSSGSGDSSGLRSSAVAVCPLQRLAARAKTRRSAAAPSLRVLTVLRTAMERALRRRARPLGESQARASLAVHWGGGAGVTLLPRFFVVDVRYRPRCGRRGGQRQRQTRARRSGSRRQAPLRSSGRWGPLTCRTAHQVLWRAGHTRAWLA